jgi:hypothetical protein
VDLTKWATISDTGRLSHGILAQSAADKGGYGEQRLFLTSASAQGGLPGAAGSVRVTIGRRIQTDGLLAHVILAQSFGGAGGGGNGFGIVSPAGDANLGCDGGVVSVTNDGSALAIGPQS